MAQSNNFFVDLHCHPNIRAYNSGYPTPNATIWENVPSLTEEDMQDKGPFANFVFQNTAGIHKESQSNFYNLAKGNARVVFVSLYPLEEGFFNLRKIPGLFTKRHRHPEIYEVIFGCAYDRMNALMDNPIDYWTELNNEYQFVKEGQGLSPDGNYRYQIVNTYEELDQLIKEDSKTIAVVLTIEGAHSLGIGQPSTLNRSEQDLKELLTERIASLKNWEHPPYNMNLAHHFWNQLTGHAKSFKGPVNALLNQNKGLNRRITDLGWHVLEELLGTHNGQRILIDTKHMSPYARKEYYEWIEAHNRNNPEDRIPIICSHTGVNGFDTMSDSIHQLDSMKKLRNSYFNNWSLNLSDEEIRIIHRSGGLIGIMFDKGVIGGGQVQQIAKQTHNLKKKRDLFTKLLLDNIFQVVEAVGEKSAWDIIGIGSDFDGAITHIDHIYDATRFPDLQYDLVDYLERTGYRQELWYGYTPQELVNKVMQENAMAHLRQNMKRATSSSTREDKELA